MININMVRVIDAEPGVSSPMTEEEARNFMTNDNSNNRLLVYLGMVDEKGEPSVIPIVSLIRTLTKSILQQERLQRKFII